MRKYIFFTVIAALLPAACHIASAQNLNPTVEVSRAYESVISAAGKPVQSMQVPDSLLRFDLDFDYSVFSNPYKGAYDFKPYLMELKPQDALRRNGGLYLRAGAGVPLIPTLDLIWSLPMKGRLKINVHASHESHIGTYRNIHAARKDAGQEAFRLIPVSSESYDKASLPDTHYGYDMSSSAGVSGYFDWKGGILSFGAGYRGIHTRDTMANTGFNAVDANLRVRSNSDKPSHFHYDARIAFRYGADRLKWSPSPSDVLKTSDFSLEGALGPVLDARRRVIADFGILSTTYSGLANHYSGPFSSSVSYLYLAPKYIRTLDRWTFSLGLRYGLVMNSPATFMGHALNSARTQGLYPDIDVDYKAIYDRLDFYASIGGGDRIHNYSGLKEANHFFNPAYGRTEAPFADNTSQRINARIGVRGNFASLFRYDLSGGYEVLGNALVQGVQATALSASGAPMDLLPSVSFRNYNVLYSELFLSWDNGPVSADGHFIYRETTFFSRGVPGYEPARFEGSLRGYYTWNRRIKGGVFLDFASSRRGYISAPALSRTYLSVVPAFADLGILLEYSLTRKLSLWARGGNLLGMNIQKTPLYSGVGVNFTGGICWSL